MILDRANWIYSDNSVKLVATLAYYQLEINYRDSDTHALIHRKHFWADRRQSIHPFFVATLARN